MAKEVHMPARAKKSFAGRRRRSGRQRSRAHAGRHHLPYGCRRSCVPTSAFCATRDKSPSVPETVTRLGAFDLSIQSGNRPTGTS